MALLMDQRRKNIELRRNMKGAFAGRAGRATDFRLRYQGGISPGVWTQGSIRGFYGTVNLHGHRVWKKSGPRGFLSAMTFIDIDGTMAPTLVMKGGMPLFLQRDAWDYAL